MTTPAPYTVQTLLAEETAWAILFAALEEQLQLNRELASGPPIGLITCRRCGDPASQQRRGRPRKWCSNACRQAAYRERHP